MNILTISGSAHRASSNQQMLRGLSSVAKEHDFTHVENLMDFPMFTPDGNEQPPDIVKTFKEKVRAADMVMVSFPEYVHNLPAVLKNAFEWITSSGELNEKKVIVMSYTPSPPRGEKAMQSVLWSLQALNAKIIAELPLYMSELKINEAGHLEGEATLEQLKALFEFL